MSAGNESLPGLSEEEFVTRYGFGVSTFYTGLPPELSTGYSPAQSVTGKHNVPNFRKLTPQTRSPTISALLGGMTEQHLRSRFGDRGFVADRRFHAQGPH